MFWGDITVENVEEDRMKEAVSLLTDAVKSIN